MDPNNEIRLLRDFLSNKYPEVYADYNNYLQSVIAGIETRGATSLNTPDEDEATSSPPKRMLIKRKAIAKDTPSGVERYAQSQKVDININAGNTKSIILDTPSTIMREPPVLERTLKAISVTDDNPERIVKPFHQFCIQDDTNHDDAPVTVSDVFHDAILNDNQIGQNELDDELDMLQQFASYFILPEDDILGTIMNDGIQGTMVDQTQSESLLSQPLPSDATHPSDWPPKEMCKNNFLPGYKISRKLSAQCENGERVGMQLRLNTAEDWTVFGTGGILPVALGAWNRDKGRYTDHSSLEESSLIAPLLNGCTNCNSLSASRYERLEDFYCIGKGLGCERRLILYRVNGGLIVFEKVDSNGEVIEHNVSAHNRRKDGKKPNNFSLTVAQKIKVLQLHGKMKPLMIASEMMNINSGIVCTDEQRNDMTTFAKVISKWSSRPETRNRYLRHSWQHQVMTKKSLKKVLDSLKSGASNIQSPLPNDICFVDSDLYNMMMKKIEVLEHDFNDGGSSSFVLFRAKDAQQKISLCGQIYLNEEGAKQGAVQFNCDFTHLPGGKFTLGMVVVEDLNHKAWPISYIISPVENAEWAKKLMTVVVKLTEENVNARCDKALVDGAAALSKAARELGVEPRNCFTHVGRLPNGSKSNGHRGTKGSLCRYLSNSSKRDGSTEKALSLKDAVKVSSLLCIVMDCV
jgi:hypothetical protein